MNVGRASTGQPSAETAPGTRRSSTRPIVEPPRLRTGERGERRATWLELFFDLVFVVAVDQVARRLEGPLTADAVLGFVILFAPVWWAWVGYVYYKDRFGTDDLSDRLLTLLQMGVALALAVRAHDALEEGAAAFAVAYGAFRLILAVRYALAAWHADEARPLALRFALGYALAALLWLGSAAVPSPARFVLWAAGFLVDFGTPITARRLNVQFPLSQTHLQERFGQFTLIVLGEAIMGVVAGLRELDWALNAALVGALGLVVAFSLWWVYFETLEGAPIDAADRGRTGVYLTWLFAHLPLAAGIAAGAVGVEQVIHAAVRPVLPDQARWLLAGASALCFAALAILNLSYASAGDVTWRRPQALSYLGTAVVAIGVGAWATGAPATGVMGVIALASAAQVSVDIWHGGRVRTRRALGLQRRAAPSRSG